MVLINCIILNTQKHNFGFPNYPKWAWLLAAVARKFEQYQKDVDLVQNK